MTKEQIRIRIRNNGLERDAWLFKGQPFTFGVVSMMDGLIEQIINYHRAEQCGFHHNQYVNSGVREQIDNNLSAVFWFERGKPVCWAGEFVEKLERDIMKQVAPVKGG